MKILVKYGRAFINKKLLLVVIEPVKILKISNKIMWKKGRSLKSALRILKIKLSKAIRSINNFVGMFFKIKNVSLEKIVHMHIVFKI